MLPGSTVVAGALRGAEESLVRRIRGRCCDQPGCHWRIWPVGVLDRLGALERNHACNMLQYVAICCNMLQYVAMKSSSLNWDLYHPFRQLSSTKPGWT